MFAAYIGGSDVFHRRGVEHCKRSLFTEVYSMNDPVRAMLGLDDLLANDTSSYELFCTLPAEVRQEAAQKDIRSFGELCAFVRSHRGRQY